MRRQIFSGSTCVPEPKSALAPIHSCQRAAAAAAPGMKRPRGHGAPLRSLAGGNPGRDRRACPAPVALCGCVCGLGRSSQAHPRRCAPRLTGAPPPPPNPSPACLTPAGLDALGPRTGRRRRRWRRCRCCAPPRPACRGLPGAAPSRPCCACPRPRRPCQGPPRRPEHGPCPCSRPHTPAPSAPVRQALGSLPRGDRSPPLPPPRMRRRAATGVRASTQPPSRAPRRPARRRPRRDHAPPPPWEPRVPALGAACPPPRGTRNRAACAVHPAAAAPSQPRCRPRAPLSRIFAPACLCRPLRAGPLQPPQSQEYTPVRPRGRPAAQPAPSLPAARGGL